MFYQFAESSLGYLMLAEQDAGAGISLLYLGDATDQLMADAEAVFPDRHWQLSDHLTPYLDEVCAALENKTPFPELPLNLAGTAFQQQVWQMLKSIPFGKTLSYSQLAERLAMPNAVRAVASACGANQVALLIPCHRVVRKSGDLSGYRWGVARKRHLLALEGQVR